MDKQIDLVEFINQEINSKKLNNKKIFIYFNRCIIKSIIELHNKFNKINNKINSVISGINMIYNIYFIIILYSNNIKLTIFLVERSLLLYSEFIIMAQDKNIIDEICFIPNITDAVSFSYKKTIGPLKLNKINIKNCNFIKDISLIMKNIIIYAYSTNKNDLSLYLTETNSTIENILYSLFNKLDKPYHSYLIYYIDTILLSSKKDKLDLIKKILKQMILYSDKNTLSINEFKLHFNSLLKL